MKIGVDEDGELVFEDVFSGVGFKTSGGDEFGICMRDSGFEFHYAGVWYEAKNGKVNQL